MTDDWKIQLNIKLADGTLINLRAADPSEAEQVFGWAENNAAQFQATINAINGVADVARAFPGATQTPWQDEQQSPAPQWAGRESPRQPSNPSPSGPAPSCAHGPMTYREGVSKKTNKPYRAFFCPAPRGQNQCDPIFQS